MIDPNFEDPAHEYEGMSPLKAAYAAVNQFFKADQANINSLDRGVEPGGAFVAPDALSEPQVKYLRDELADRHGGIGNRGRPMVLHGGMDWKPIARAYAEMEFSLLRTMSRTDICAVFNVPPAVIGY